MTQVNFSYGNAALALNKNKKFIAIKTTNGQMLPETEEIERDISLFTPQLDEFRLYPVCLSDGTRAIDSSEEATAEDISRTVNELQAQENVSQAAYLYYDAEDTAETPVLPNGEIYIIFKENTSRAACITLLRQNHLNILEKRDKKTYIVAINSAEANIFQVVENLQNASEVAIAEPDLVMPVSLNDISLPTDDLMQSQWHLRNTGSHAPWPASLFSVGADAKIIDAWEEIGNLGSNSITVAVIDDGFDITHPDLKGNGNKIVQPWNFRTNSPNVMATATETHGTPCAGLAVGAANGSGIVGAAPNARLMPIRFSSLSDMQVEQWFNYAALNGADVISCSWGFASVTTPLSTRKINAIRACATNGRNGKGCVIVFAAGNEGRRINNDDPNLIVGFATHPNVISVSASNSKDLRASYSNFGTQVTVCGPSGGSGGAFVTTADLTGTNAQGAYLGFHQTDYTASFTGTSASCPIIAGICGLVLSANPTLKSEEVKEIIQNTADKIGAAASYINGHSMFFGYGRINAQKAVEEAANMEGGIHYQSSKNLHPDAAFAVPLKMTGRAVSSKNLQSNEDAIFKVNVLPNKLEFKIVGLSGVNNFDLYVKKDDVPTTDSFDAKSTAVITNETLTIDNVSKGDYYVRVKNMSGNGIFRLYVTQK
ncbi:MAG: S8 family serine peptidase [Chitinophagales bacterium]